MRLTLLGSGGSSGVPVIGNQWGQCDPADPRNRRTRPSLLVEDQGTTLLVDTGPDLRQQLLAADVRRIDAVFYSHAHADHSHGIDELREVNRLMGRAIDLYGDAATVADLSQRFAYCFEPLPPEAPIYRPVLVAHTLEAPPQPLTVGGIEVRPFVQDHGLSLSMGYRFGRAAYSTDVKRLDEAAFATLEGVEVWVVDCVRVEPEHAVHAHLALTLSWIERVRPRLAVLTHMNHTMDYQELCRLLPPGVVPGYDGLRLEL